MKTSKLSPYLRLIRFDKPIGTLLLLWPTLWALWFANQGRPDFRLLIIFTAGTFLMRSIGCVMNDIADREFDKKVTRTKLRPLATGELSIKEAVGVIILLGLISFLLLLQLNTYTIFLGLIGFVLAATYPYVKRLTHFPQVYLGLAFSWGIPMAYAATLHRVPFSGWVLFAIAVLWPIAYDTIYAMVDREDDVKIGVKSTAIIFGKADVPIVMFLQLTVLITLGFFGYSQNVNHYFYLGIVGAILLSGYQYFLIHHRDPARCFKAFLNNHWVGMSVFLGIFLSYSLA